MNDFLTMVKIKKEGMVTVAQVSVKKKKKESGAFMDESPSL
jgi:hypothetical protein